MSWARIDSGKVQEIIAIDPLGKFHDDLVFETIPATLDPYVDQQWLYDGSNFVPADLAQFKARLQRQANAWAKDLRRTIAGTDDDIEIATWPSKEQAAMRHAAGTATTDDATALGAEAALRGETVDQLAAIINAKAALFRPAAGIITGLMSQFAAGLDAALDAPAAIAAFDALMAAPELAALPPGAP